jgi:hypothetical protein
MSRQWVAGINDTDHRQSVIPYAIADTLYDLINYINEHHLRDEPSGWEYDVYEQVYWRRETKNPYQPVWVLKELDNVSD